MSSIGSLGKFVGFGFALSLGLPSAAGANALLSAPPDKYVVSPGGVDMRSGRYAYTHTELSIGGDGGIELTRTLNQQALGHVNPFANFSHNFDMMVVETRVNINQGNFRSGTGTDYQIQVAFGGLSQTFRSPGAAGYGFQLASTSNYATLSYANGDRNLASTVYTYQDSSGDVAVFRPIGNAATSDCSNVVRCAYISQLTRADGTVLSFGYSTGSGANSAQLVSVTSTRGFALLLQYSGAVVVKACVINLGITTKPAINTCPAGVPTATYAYDSLAGEQRLASATDAANATWSFINGTSSTGTTLGFVNPGEGAPWLTNQLRQWFDDDNVRYDIVDGQSFSDGRTYTYGYNTSPLIPDHNPSLAGGVITDGLGRHTYVTYDFPVRPGSPSPAQNSCQRFPCTFYDVGDEVDNSVYQMTPGPVAVTDPLNRTTTYDYCDPYAEANYPAGQANRCLVAAAAYSTTNPGSITTNLTWDFATNHLLQSDELTRTGTALPTLTRKATYNCTPSTLRYCDKPTSYTDANGNVTNFAYDAQHGGILSEMKPFPTTGAARPLKLTSWAQKYAWYKNSSGVLAQASTPVWIVASETQCQTAAGSSSPVCDPAAPQRVTTYEYGPDGSPNSLFVRGILVSADGTGRRTCYSYDNLGNRISQTSARAGLTTCP